MVGHFDENVITAKFENGITTNIRPYDWDGRIDEGPNLVKEAIDEINLRTYEEEYVKNGDEKDIYKPYSQDWIKFQGFAARGNFKILSNNHGLIFPKSHPQDHVIILVQIAS